MSDNAKKSVQVGTPVPLMARIFWHVMTLIFVSFGILHFFLDETLVGPAGLLVFGALNLLSALFYRFFPTRLEIPVYWSMFLLTMAVAWYILASDESVTSPAIMVALTFPGVVYYLLGLRHGIIWTIIIFCIHTFFVFGGKEVFLQIIPVIPQIRADRMIADYWVVFSVMLVMSFLVSHIIVWQKNQLDNQIRTDPLTGILNRRGLLERLQSELSLYYRHNSRLSALMIDADHFKKINDQYGHNVGDQVLIKLAKTIQERLRNGDFVGRWGGEEFIAVLPMTTVEGAAVFAESLRQNIEQIVLENDSQIKISVTVSIGVGALKKDDVSIEKFIQRIDEALYEAKRGGRNRIVVF